MKYVSVSFAMLFPIMRDQDRRSIPINDTIESIILSTTLPVEAGLWRSSAVSDVSLVSSLEYPSDSSCIRLNFCCLYLVKSSWARS